MIPQRVRDDLRTLTTTPGLAGHERRVASYMTERMTPHADDIHTDTLGNVIATLHGTNDDAPTLMLFAHMDSLGFIVRKIDDDGYTRIHRLGGIPIKTLPATPVTLTTPQGDIPGIIATKAHHVTPPQEKTTVTPIDAPSPTKGTSSASASTASPPRSSTIAADARPCSRSHVDGSAAGDTPDLAHLSDVALGEGPMLNLYNFHGRGTLNGLLPHPVLVRMTEEAASGRDLPIQRNANFGGLTDAAYVQLVRDGIAALDLGIPRRYLHSQREVCDLRDLAALIELCEGLLHAFEAGMRWERWQ